MDRALHPASFERWGAVPCAGGPASPVVISVSHAGRDYPPALRAALSVGHAAAVALEDRHIDAVAPAARGAECLLIQRRARAWIDLNRGEDERDPAVDEGAPSAETSARVRSGLGLIPRRAGQGQLWRRRWTDAEVAARIATDHRPYHVQLAADLDAARARWGVAVLLDLHSMPPLTGAARGTRAVLGDRFGRATHPRFVARAQSALAAAGLMPALNSPYAGGYILDRHGRPVEGVHAIQLELDRSLYLDRTLDRPGPGLERTAAAVRAVIVALADEAVASVVPLAAE